MRASLSRIVGGDASKSIQDSGWRCQQVYPG